MNRLAAAFAPVTHVLLFVLGLVLLGTAAAASIEPAVATAMVVAGAGLAALGALAPRLVGDVELGAGGFKGRLLEVGLPERDAAKLVELASEIIDLRRALSRPEPFEFTPSQREMVFDFIRRHPRVLSAGAPTGGAAIAEPARPSGPSGGAAIKGSDN